MTSDSMEQPALSPGLETLVVSRTHDLVDGFSVRRVLPSAKRRMVGPFIFFDQMGPEILSDGQGLDVAAHPHIGLATVTYLFSGDLVHRDSLGTLQRISQGDVNWMNAGRGIAHSERTPPEQRREGTKLFGLQSWVALPEADEDRDASFAHYPESELPQIEEDGVKLRLIAGEMYGERSPVRTSSPMFYADARLDSSARLPIPPDHEERAVYVLEGLVRTEGGSENFEPGQLLVLEPGKTLTITPANQRRAHVMLLGGARLGPRHIWWNFVSSSKDRIEQAKDDWRAGRFAPVPGEQEYIPVPGEGPAIVRYP